MAEPPALRGARDQPGQVGDDERALRVHAHDAERRRERGEGVAGDLRPGGGQPRDQRRLARVRVADHAHVGEQPELEVEPALGAGAAEVGAARRLVRGGREAGVAAAAGRSAHGPQALAGLGEVAEALAAVALGDDGAERHVEHEVLAARPVAIGALAVLAALGVVVALVVVIEERGQRGVGLEPDAGARAAVPPVGSAAGHVLLAAEADAAGAPVAPLDEDVDLVDEHVARGPGGRPPGGHAWSEAMLT